MININIVERIQKAGVVGAGGAGFPTSVKINAKADYFIINGAECEPLIETDKFFMRNFAEELIRTTDIVADHLGATNRYIALKSKYLDEISMLESEIKKQNSTIKLHKMEAFYPAGDEQIIVREITGKGVPERGIPLAVGAVVNNVVTVLNIANALIGKPVTEKYFSITGEVEKPIMVKAPIGTKIMDCIKIAKPTLENYIVIMGGPMMGRVVSNKDAINNLTITKTDGNILLLPTDSYMAKNAVLPIKKLQARTISSCIQCKFCTTLCPRFLNGHNVTPHLVMKNLYRLDTIGDDEEFLTAFGSAANCSCCGICEVFSCPMGLHPRKVNAYIKGELRNRNIALDINTDPNLRGDVKIKYVPTNKIISRLGLTKYAERHADNTVSSVDPQSVSIRLSQHIGAPATAVVNVGDSVKVGDLIGKASETGISANIHASIDGIVKSVSHEIIITKG